MQDYTSYFCLYSLLYPLPGTSFSHSQYLFTYEQILSIFWVPIPMSHLPRSLLGFLSLGILIPFICTFLRHWALSTLDYTFCRRAMIKWIETAKVILKIDTYVLTQLPETVSHLQTDLDPQECWSGTIKMLSTMNLSSHCLAPLLLGCFIGYASSFISHIKSISIPGTKMVRTPIWW